MSFDESFHSNLVIDERGETVTLRAVTTFHDPETGDEIATTVSDTTVIAYLEEYTLEEKLVFAGIVPKLDIRACFKVGVTVSIGDQLIRYPGATNEKIFDIVNLKQCGAYIEADLKRRED